MFVVSGLGRVSEGGLECFSVQLCREKRDRAQSVDSILDAQII